MIGSLLSCESLEMRAGYIPLFSRFSLKVYPSDTIAITGCNGAGKTTLLRCLGGLETPHAGIIKRTHPCFWMSHPPGLLMDHPVKKNIKFFLKSFSRPYSHLNVIEVLNSVGLSGKQDVLASYLSTGQKQRLLIAAALLVKPKVILADEPTSGLDVLGIQMCLNIFSHLVLEHKTAFVIATHDPQLIAWCHKNISLLTPRTRKKQLPPVVRLE
jgi:putative ABC transport system ATP-binding protein